MQLKKSNPFVEIISVFSEIDQNNIGPVLAVLPHAEFWKLAKFVESLCHKYIRWPSIQICNITKLNICFSFIIVITLITMGRAKTGNDGMAEFETRNHRNRIY